MEPAWIHHVLVVKVRAGCFYPDVAFASERHALVFN